MKEQNQLNDEGYQAWSHTLRDLLAVGFRHRRLLLLSLLGIFLAALLYALLRTDRYEAQMKIMVKHQRADPPVTSDEMSLPDSGRAVTEQELNSEIELLRSRDLLEKVAISFGLHRTIDDSWLASIQKRILTAIGRAPDEDTRLAQVVFSLEHKIEIELLKNSNLIRVTYSSPDRQLSARILNKLADLYLEKHVAVHRPPGAFDFFQQEAERYRKGLTLVETRLAAYGRDQGIVSLPLEKEILLRRVNDYEAALQGTQGEVAATRERILTLESQAASIPSRMTTQVRTSSGRLLEQLQSALLTLEMKRIELLGIYQPTYPLVQEVEKQIAETRDAVAASQNAPLLEETSDLDPTHQWLRSELAKAKSELAALQARATATARALSFYREKSRRLDQIEMVQQDLIRDAKLTEQNYVVYVRKQEEARISDALDRQRIVNVAIAEAATVPFLPSGPPRLLIMLLGGILASLVSVFLAFAADYWDPSFRTPHEVESFLNVPVAAAMLKKVG